MLSLPLQISILVTVLSIQVVLPFYTHKTPSLFLTVKSAYLPFAAQHQTSVASKYTNLGYYYHYFL